MSQATSSFPFIEVIEWVEYDRDVVMWKIPDGDKEIKNGAKLIVRESQAALLVDQGHIADVFPAGTHSLSTQNIPILSRLKGWKYGFESPYKTDVYFFAIRQFVNLKWGTPAPVMMRDPQFGQVRVRAFGTYNVRVTDPSKFFREYAGTFPELSIAELEKQLRDFIAPKFGEALARAAISVVDIASNLSLLNDRIHPLIQPYFNDFGIEVTQFTVTSANLPEEVTTYYDKVTGMNMVTDSDKFQRFNTAIATSSENNPAQSGVQQGVALGILMDQMNQAKTPQPPPIAETASQTGNSIDTITSRLKELKTLFESGLIDESEYKAKKATLLEKL